MCADVAVLGAARQDLVADDENGGGDLSVGLSVAHECRSCSFGRRRFSIRRLGLGPPDQLHRGAGPTNPPPMRFKTPLIRGRLIKRYKRFLADVALDSGGTITATCSNTGLDAGVDRARLGCVAVRER